MKNNELKNIKYLKEKIDDFNKEYKTNLTYKIIKDGMIDLFNGKDHLYTAHIRHIREVLNGMALQYHTNTIRNYTKLI